MLPKTPLKLILGALVVPAVLSIQLVSPRAASSTERSVEARLVTHVVNPCTGATGTLHRTLRGAVRSDLSGSLRSVDVTFTPDDPAQPVLHGIYAGRVSAGAFSIRASVGGAHVVERLAVNADGTVGEIVPATLACD
jgi:hypothetical protein